MDSPEQPKVPQAKKPNQAFGAPWPESFLDLEPLVRQQWGIEGEIYLLRKLSGRSKAEVYAADLIGRDFTGQAILKLSRAPNPEWQVADEAKRHQRAFETAPGYAAAHLPKLLYSLHHGDMLAILSSIVGGGLEYAVPWAECTYDRKMAAVRELSRGLLEDWNSDYRRSKGLHAPHELLEAWLAHRIDPQQGRIHGFLVDDCGLGAEEPSFTFEGNWYPNPYAFARNLRPLPDRARLRAVRGKQHGDLHGNNVLVATQPGQEASYHLIDLAMFRDDQFLFYDHAYLELSYLLLSRNTVAPSAWDSLLDYLSRFDHQDEPAGLDVDDLGLVQLVDALRRGIFDWVERHEANRLSNMESQCLLARTAAGLNYANKLLPRQMRGIAFLYAALSLKDYLKLNDLDWPKHGPAFALARLAGRQAASQAAGDLATPALGTTGEQSDPTTPTSDSLPAKPAVAVMPIVNLSGDPAQDSFADGMTEEIITELSRIDWLTVPARNVTFAYKGKTIAPQQVAGELGVQYLVEGSVRRAGESVRISAQLIDGRDGHYVWAERFDRDLDDVLRVQEEIAHAIASSIDSRVRHSERERARRSPGPFSVWDRYQQGIWHLYQFTREEAELARSRFDEAIQKAPHFAEPYAMLSLMETLKILVGSFDEVAPVLDKALQHAEKAVALDDGSSLAHTALGRVYSIRGNFDKAASEFEIASELNPSSVFAAANIGAGLCWSGRAEEALALMKRFDRTKSTGALRILRLGMQAYASYFLGDFEQTESVARKVRDRSMMGHPASLLLAACLAHRGRLDEARAVVAEIRRNRPEASIARVESAVANMYPPYRDMFLADLRKAGLD